MTSPHKDHGRPREKIVTSCTSKNRYSDQPTAIAMGMQQEGIYEGSKIYHYHCEICRGWHITHYDRGPSGKKNARCSLDLFSKKRG